MLALRKSVRRDAREGWSGLKLRQMSFLVYFCWSWCATDIALSYRSSCSVVKTYFIELKSDKLSEDKARNVSEEKLRNRAVHKNRELRDCHEAFLKLPIDYHSISSRHYDFKMIPFSCNWLAMEVIMYVTLWIGRISFVSRFPGSFISETTFLLARKFSFRLSVFYPRYLESEI